MYVSVSLYVCVYTHIFGVGGGGHDTTFVVTQIQILVVIASNFNISVMT